MIGERFNFEDVFFRDLTVCVLDTLEGQVKWVNKFSSGDVFVQVPFYYSLTGDERFLLDSFQDDIVSENRFVELNTDIIPRGHLTMTGFNIKSDEFANPNVWLRMVVENELEIRKVLAKVRAIPISVTYDLTITLSNEIDTFKCSQAIMDTLWIYKFMYFEHNFMNIDAVILMPDTNQIEMAREKNLTSDNNITLKASFTVETYYPAFRKDRISATGYPTSYGEDTERDLNSYPIDGGISSLFSQPPYGNTDGNNFPNRFGPPGYPPPFPPFGPNIGGTEQVVITGTGINTGPVGPVVPGGGTGSGINTGSIGVTGSWYPGGNPAGNGVAQTVVNGQYTSDPDYFMTNPRRTRWFSNILRARERSASGTGNPNAGNPNPSNNGNPSN
jgi:hypothetical protein